MNPRELISFKEQALLWAGQFDVCCCFDSNGYSDTYSGFEFLLAADSMEHLDAMAGNAFEELKLFRDQHAGWMFGTLGYDLKNETEQLSSVHENHLEFPDLFFFVPRFLIAVKNGEAEILKGPGDLLQQIGLFGQQTLLKKPLLPAEKVKTQQLHLQSRMDKQTYIHKVEELREYISRGDIYEVNFCQEFFATQASINPYTVYSNLTRLSPTPFAGFFKINDKYILSASPERYLRKQGEQLISQPIKGTARRSPDPEEDEYIKKALKNNKKEQAENVMIVDLVRNDLTKAAVPGSVQVDELFGIYTFPQVHQMISTISCRIRPELHPIDAIRYTFPMGSMTGAPKIRAMELIESTEMSRRGLYSGAFGYLDPKGDFDFNVIIRSILYHDTRNYLSFQVGGAITYASSAESEYEECLLKASAILNTLKAM